MQDYNFNNRASSLLFIGQRDLRKVIEQDRLELEKVEGSFVQIADRMDEIVKAAERMKCSLPADLDDKVRIMLYVTTRGQQACPFSRDCLIDGYTGWNEDVLIVNPTTRRELVLNSGTTHLARTHSLLEKDNKYGISAREFYEHFM